MSDAHNQTITRLLHSWTDGNPYAADALSAEVRAPALRLITSC